MNSDIDYGPWDSDVLRFELDYLELMELDI